MSNYPFDLKGGWSLLGVKALNLPENVIEEAIYDSYALRRCMKINFVNEQIPGATTLLKARHLLEDHVFGKTFFRAFKPISAF